MKNESPWPQVSYIASLIGAATILILRLYAAQMGGAQFSSRGLFPIILGISPFLFGLLVLHFNDTPRAQKYLSWAIVLQGLGAIAGSYHAIFMEAGLEASEDLGLVPLYQFIFLGIAAGLAQFITEKKTRGVVLKK